MRADPKARGKFKGLSSSRDQLVFLQLPLFRRKRWIWEGCTSRYHEEWLQVGLAQAVAQMTEGDIVRVKLPVLRLSMDPERAYR